MPEPNSVDTPETTNELESQEQEQVQPADVDTVETTSDEGEEWTEEQQQEYIASMLKNGGGGSDETTEERESTESTEEKEDDESEESEVEEVDTETESEPEIEQEATTGVIEIEVDGVKETFDVADPEQREKLIQFAGKGRFLERERQKDAETAKQLSGYQKQLDTQAASVGLQMLYLANEGKISEEDFQEKPYEFFVGKGEDEKDDLRLWNEDKRRVADNANRLKEFSERYKQSFKSFVDITEKFSQAHPDVKDVATWVDENISPYQNAVLSYGALPYPPDTLEMIHFWKNKDEIIKNKVAEALKAHIKTKPIKTKLNTGVNAPTTKVEVTPVKDAISKMFNPDGRKLVH